jgi:hypothetical protein
MTDENPRVYVVVVPRDALGGAGNSFADFHETSVPHTANGVRPDSVATLLFALLEAVRSFGEAAAAPPEASSKGKGKEAAEDPDAAAVSSDHASGLFMQTSEDEHWQRVALYVEAVRAPDERLLEYRVWFVVHDPTLDMGDALERTFARAAERFEHDRAREKTKSRADFASAWQAYLYRLTSREKWIGDVAGPYVHHAGTDDMGLMSRSVGYRLNDARNPLNVSDMLSLERAIARTHVDAAPEFKTHPYFECIKTSNGRRRTFPRGAILVHPSQQRPEIMWWLDLDPDASTRADCVSGANVRRANAMGWARIEREAGESPRDALREIAAQNAAALASRGENVSAREMRSSVEFEDRFHRLTTPGADVGPAIDALFRFYDGMRANHVAAVEERERAGGGARLEGVPRRLSLVRRVNMMDPMLSVFGNFMARWVYLFDIVFGMVYYHEEAMMMQVFRAQAFKENASIRLHAMFTGIPAGGKSFLLNLMTRLSIPGLVDRVDHLTPRAFATEGDKDYMCVCFDEIPDSFVATDDKGQGSSHIKALMTQTSNHTTSFGRDDRGRRLAVESTMRTQMTFIGATNRSIGDMDPAIRSRWYTHTCGTFERPGCDVGAQRVARVFRDRTYNKKSEETIVTEFRVFQFLVANIRLRITAGQMVEPDMRVAALIVERALAHLRTQGYDVDSRGVERIVEVAECLVLIDAVANVFFTTQHYATGTPFELDHVMTCQQHMVSTFEHAWFALTMMRGVVANAYSEITMLGIAEHLASYSLCRGVMSPSCKPTFLEGAGGHRDYNYVQIRATSCAMGATEREVLFNVASQLATKSLATAVSLSKESIADILTRFKSTTRSVIVRGDDGELTTTMRAYPIVRVDTYPKRVAILRDYLDAAFRRRDEDRDVVLDAVRATCYDHLPSRRAVLGNTLRLERVMHGLDILPQFLKTETFRADPRIELRVPVAAHRPVGCELIDPEFGDVSAYSSAIDDRVDRCFETYARETYLADVEIDNPKHATFDAAREWVLSTYTGPEVRSRPMCYPDAWITSIFERPAAASSSSSAEGGSRAPSPTQSSSSSESAYNRILRASADVKGDPYVDPNGVADAKRSRSS